jgi:hypothetical protein
MKYQWDLFDVISFVIIALVVSAFNTGCVYVKEIDPGQMEPAVQGFGDTETKTSESKKEDNPKCELNNLKTNGLDYHDYNRTEYLCRYRIDTSYNMVNFEIAFFRDYRGYLNTHDREFRFVRYKYSPTECKYVVVNDSGILEFEISNPRLDEFGRIRSFFMWDLYTNKVNHATCDIIYGPIN